MKVHQRLAAGLLRPNHGDAERHAFWGEVERRLGTPVLGHGLGRYLTGEVDPGPLCGLLYCTAGALYFHHFAQPSWFSAFTGNVGATSNRQRPVREREIEYQIEFATCRQLCEPPQPTLLQRLFGREDAVYRLLRTDPGAATFTFSIDHRREQFVTTLSAAFDRSRTAKPCTDRS